MQPLQKAGWRFLKKLKIKLLHDTAISVLAMYLTEMKTVSQRDICIRMFIKKHYSLQPRLGNNISGQKKCGMYKMEHIQSWIFLNIIQKEHPAICDNMDGTWGHYAEWDKSERGRKILQSITYTWNLFF